MAGAASDGPRPRRGRSAYERKSKARDLINTNMSTPQQSDEVREQRVLLLTEDAPEREMLRAVLDAADLAADPCASVAELCTKIAHGAGAVVIGEHVLSENRRRQLEAALDDQPEWSDVPLIVLTGGESTEDTSWSVLQQMESIGNVTLLEKPIGARSLVSALRVALRSRQRQYQLRHHLAEHERTEGRLRATASSMGDRAQEQAQALRLLRDVATAANFAESVDEALSFALAQVCRYTGWAFGHAFLPAADDSATLVPVDASYEQAPGRFEVFRTATLGLRIPRGTGLIGRVYATGQPEWTRGIDRELQERRAELGEDLGIVTAAAFPIMAGVEVVGVLEFFSEEVADPDAALLDAMTSIGTQLGRVIERDRMDRAVRDSYRLLDKIAETSPTMIRILDHTEGRYVHVNEGMARFFGTTAEEALRAGFDHLPEAIHPDDRAHYYDAKAELRKPEHDARVTWQARMRNAAGQWRWIRTWSVVFTRDEEGLPAQILSISVDVTDQVEIETRLRQTERLTSIGTLAAGIAHEVNNPLASMIMTAQLLRRKNLGPEINRMLDDVIQDGKRCAKIVRSVQKFARQEPSDRVPLDLNSVVRAAEELSHTQLRHSGIELRLELTDRLPPVVGDATELEQVLLNLITNAAHASESGQAVVVSTTVGDGFARFRVKDEGHGMSEEVKRHVFDPFFTTRVRQGGTGLGLSIAYGLVQDQGGTIDIDSEVGRGTTVTVSLPVSSESR